MSPRQTTPMRRPPHPRTGASLSTALPALALLSAACTGQITDPGGAVGTGDGTGGPTADGAVVVPEVSGLRRLTIEEYDRTLEDLIGDDTRPGQALLPRDVRNPFDNDYTTQVASQALVEGVEVLAAEAAQRLLDDPERLDRVLGCTPEEPGDAACLRSFVTRFGRRALRRPLPPERVDAYVGTIALAEEAGDFHVAVETVLRAMLQHPRFLYRVEIGTPTEDDPAIRKLDDWEMAARLSYLLWGTTPDEWLLDVAADDGLSTAAGVREVATAMLGDERARDRVDRFHALWLGYETLPFDPELTQAMRTESAALVDRVVFEERRPWRDLFLLEETYVDDALAGHYGMPLPGSETPVWTAYGDSGRRGLLSHGTFLSNGAKLDDTSPVLRGLAVRTRLLCEDIPPPPPGVDVDDPLPETEDAVCKEDKLAMHRQGGCAGCHSLMDPIGFGLERFDAQGRIRDHDPGHPECVISGEGEIAGEGTFNGPGELGQLLLDTGLDRCLFTQLYRFAIGRYELDDRDVRFIDRVDRELGGSGFRFDTLLLEIVSSEAFRFRREEE